MAKQVQAIEARLNIKGAEKISALKRSFRDLGKTVNLTDELIQSARKDIIDYGKAAIQSEALIKRQIKAFEGLRDEAEAGGNAYRGLSSDINELKARLIGSSSAIESQRKGLVSLGESANSSQSQIKRVIDKLIELRGQVRLDSESFRQLGVDISSLNAKFNQLTEEAEQLALAQKSLNQSVSASAGGASKQLQNIRSVTQSLREQREELGALSNEQELVQRRQRIGLQSLVDRGVKPSGRRSFEDVISRSTLSFGEIKIEDLVPVKDLRAAEEEVKLILKDLQFQIEKSLSRGAIVSFQETARSARESARSLAQAFADPELLNILSRLDERIGELPKTTAGFNQRLRELQQQLANTARDSDAYVSVSLEIARVQREAAAATQGLGAALIKDLASGVAVRNQKNLREAIGQLQAEMSELNTETTEGSAKYAENARQVNNLQKDLDQIANSYRNVAEMTRRATASQVDYGAVARKMYLERDQPGYKTPAEIRGKQFLERIDAERQVLRQTLALPAAGQTSALGTGLERSGGAKTLGISREVVRGAPSVDVSSPALGLSEEAKEAILARKSAASAFGLGGREDISSLYKEIIGLSTADTRRRREMMGKSATEVFNDIVTAFEKGGRAVDLKSKSTDIGDDIAEGVSKGASDSDEINKGAKSFAQKLIAAYKSVFGIRSPSKETEQKIGIPLGLGIIRGLLSAIRSSKQEVQKEIEQIADPLIQKSRQPRRLIGTVNEPVATFTGFGTRARPATPGYRPLPARSQSLDTEIERLFNQFRVNIAAVTTDAEIYYNLLQSLPTSKITTDLANIASRRARAAEVPGFIQAQRQIGPGELEREIASSVAGYLKELRTPNPWVGVVGDYEEFIESVASKTKTLIRVREQLERFTNQKLLPGTRIAGLLPESRIGFAADKERLQRISQIGQTRALPPAERRFGELQNPGVSMFSPAGTAREYQKMARLLAEASSDLAAAKRYINEVGFENLPVEVTGFLGDELTQALRGYSLQARGLPAAGYPEVRGIFSSESQGFRGRQFGQFDFGGQRALPSSEILRGAVRALPPGVSREERFAERTRIANQRSRERSASVLEEDFFAGSNRNLLSAGGSGGSGGGRRGRIADDFGSASNELKSLKQEFGLFTNVSERSTKNLREFASAIRFLQDDLDPLSGDFNKVNKQITDQSNLIERELQKRERQQRRRRPLSGGQVAQAAGAAFSGGIFGGPEGFLGGVGGALIGGVGGSFTGAAFGAQLGGIRRQLGEFAAYAAQIEKLKISLKGITGSQEEYSRALAAAAGATEKLNIPQETAIQGITRLTAAVKGAGGGVADAELAFNSINSAIIATGGGAEQVEGAITALVQIFSKGKVSAEEINQIAERLPGTFNKIAEASGRTGPELSKALQDGKVGLNDLQKFLISLGSEYGELAEKIANSSQAAGARLQKSFDKLRKNVGDALQPIGAEFQSVFADFVEDITPVLVAVLPKIGEAALFLAKNLDVLAVSAGTAFAAIGVSKIVAVGGLSAALLKLAAAAGTASVALQGVAAAAFLNPWVLLAAGISAATVGIYKYYEGQKELNSLLDDGAGSTQVIKDKITEYEDSIRKATARLKAINGEQKPTGRDAQRLKRQIRELRGELERLKGTYEIRVEYERKGYKFDEDGVLKEFTVGGIVYGGEPGARAKPLRRVNGQPLDGELSGSEEEPTGDTAAQSLLNAIEQRENSIARARIQLEEQAADIRKQAIEQARQLEERFADQRLQKERDLQDLRRQLANVEEDIAFGAEEARAVAAGADPEIFAARRQIIDFSRQQKEEEIALDRQFLDEQTENTKALEEFKINSAKAINEANEAYAKQIGRIQQEYARNVAKIIEEGTGRAGKRLEISSKIAAEFIKQGQATAKLREYGVYVDDAGTPKVVPGTVLDAQEYAAIQAQVTLYSLAAEKIKEYTEELNALPTSAAIAAPAITSIGNVTADLDRKAIALAKNLDAARAQIRGISKDLADKEFLEKVSSVFSGTGDGIFAQQKSLASQQSQQRRILRLREEGFSGEVAGQLVNQEDLVASQLRILEAQFEEAKKERPQLEESLTKNFKETKENIDASNNSIREFIVALDNIPTEIKLRTAVVDVKQQLRDLVDTSNLIQGAATTIGDAFSQSFTDAITGSKSAKEALSDFFKSVGSFFLDFAKQVIAKLIQIAILNAATRLLPGLSGGGGFNLGTTKLGAGSKGVLGGIGTLGPNFGIAQFADGGRPPINKPSIVGERGPELFVPFQQGTIVSNEDLQEQMAKAGLPSMERSSSSRFRETRDSSSSRFRETREVMVPFTRSAEQLSVASAERETAQAISNPGPLDVRFESQVINNVEYVTADQYRKGMSQAAERGRALTLEALQNSVKARKRIGL